jgi:type II secretory ATPase GspE/PulE/Tfp pilus assembly ATPase PilB-like protein
MVDLGVEPFLLSSALLGVVAQRMVRRIDSHCQAPYEPDEEELRALGNPTIGPETRFHKGEGCYFCSFTGYHGRTGLFEILTPSDEFKAMILRSAGQAELLEQATADGFRTMKQDGIQKALTGVTTPFEILRSVYAL